MTARAPMPSRRALLGAAAAVPLAALAAPAAAAVLPGDDDAELLRLAAEYQRHEERSLTLTLRHARTVGQFPPEVDAELDSLVPVLHDLAEQIADMHAGTIAGLRAKAGVLLHHTAYTSDGDPLWTNHNDLLGWSIARDLLGDEAAKPPEDQARWRAIVPPDPGEGV